jgi:hypothetical protein
VASRNGTPDIPTRLRCGAAHHHDHRASSFPPASRSFAAPEIQPHSRGAAPAIGHFHHQDLAAHVVYGERIQRAPRRSV